MKALPLLAAALLWFGQSRAAETAAVHAHCIGARPPLEEPLHAFSGKPLPFLMAVDAPAGSRLRLVADLFQTAAGNIAAPVQKDVPVSGELAFPDLTHLTVPCSLPSLPLVQRITRFVLHLRAVAGEGGPYSPTSVEVIAYPPEQPGEWEKAFATGLAQCGLTRLEVFGKGQALRGFLKARGVAFEDGGSEWPGELNAQTLYAGDEPPPLSAPVSEGLHLVLFQSADQPASLPGVDRNADVRGGSTIKVNVRDLLNHLDDDPRAQQTLAKVFRLVLEPRP